VLLNYHIGRLILSSLGVGDLVRLGLSYVYWAASTVILSYLFKVDKILHERASFRKLRTRHTVQIK
jgi:hypothetical protein